MYLLAKANLEAKEQDASDGGKDIIIAFILSNLVDSIRSTGTTRHYAQKPEIPKTRWPSTPSWIFMQV